MIETERVKRLNDKSESGGQFVIYWMQAAQRSRYNQALEAAVIKSNRLGQPLLVVFCIDSSFPEANSRHFYFMLQGLSDVSRALHDRGIGFTVIQGSPSDIIPEIAKKASWLITDAGYTRVQKLWRKAVAGAVDIPFVQVATEAVVPVETAMQKESWTAATLRPRIMKQLGYFLNPLNENELKNKSAVESEFESFDVSDPAAALEKLELDFSISPVEGIAGGQTEADRALEYFIGKRLDRYDEFQRDPVLGGASGMSPFLHFGQISPLDTALRVIEAGSPGTDKYIEQLIVRRELSMNFCHYNPEYDRYGALPAWALKTLGEHSGDERPYLYTSAQLEAAETHDPYWNAAQMEMVKTGFMHNYMRMYWGKKILEWMKSPEEAFNTAVYLNNKYQLDGRDPNGFAGVAWCFGKHDQGWKERPVFGKIRYMNAAGLKRKFDIDLYVGRVENI